MATRACRARRATPADDEARLCIYRRMRLKYEGLNPLIVPRKYLISPCDVMWASIRSARFCVLPTFFDTYGYMWPNSSSRCRFEFCPRRARGVRRLLRRTRCARMTRSDGR